MWWRFELGTCPDRLDQHEDKSSSCRFFREDFFRNLINLGLSLVVCKGISQKVKPGQTLEVDIQESTVRVEETGEA